MFSIRAWRPITNGCYRCLVETPVTLQRYNLPARSISKRNVSVRTRPGPIRKKNNEDNTIEGPFKDSPDVIALKTLIVKEIHKPAINLDAIPDVTAGYQKLIQAETILSRSLTHSLISWFCRAFRLSNRLLVTNKRAAGKLNVRQKQSQLQSLIDDFLAQYKQGRFITNGDVPSTILFHYHDAGEIDKALNLWEWLCRMREPGHLTYRGYAARIAVAETIGEGFDKCEALYQEALDKFGDSMVNYHLSHNAALVDPKQPIEKHVADAIPLLRTMFSVRLRNGYWRDAYLTLDTILRLDPRRLWPTAKTEVLSFQSSWEAFLIESLESRSSLSNTAPSLATRWLEVIILHSDGEKSLMNPQLLHSAACALLASLKRRCDAIVQLNENSDLPMHQGNFHDFELLWKCWLRLYQLHGKESDSTRYKDSEHVMADFIQTNLSELNFKYTSDFRLRIKKNLKLISKLDGVNEKKEECASILADLRRRILDFKNQEDATHASLENIPFWSSLLTREDMLQLYRDLAQSETEPQQDVELEDEIPSDELEVSEHEGAELVFETKTGLDFAEARFQSWMAINNMFLAADALEKGQSLHSQSMLPGLEPSLALSQEKLLHGLNLDDSSQSQTEEQKRFSLLERLKTFRQHQGT